MNDNSQFRVINTVVMILPENPCWILVHSAFLTSYLCGDIYSDVSLLQCIIGTSGEIKTRIKMNNLIKLLSEVGFAAVKSGNFESAQTIFLSLRHAEPDNAAGSIGLASIAMANGNMDEAIALLDESAFTKQRNAHEAKKLLLIATMLKGDQEKAGQVHKSLATERQEQPSEERLAESEAFFAQ